MNLFQVLSCNERQIVHSSEEDRYIYTWNQSCTLQCWLDYGAGRYEEIDARTLSDAPLSFDKARQAAVRWHEEASAK